MDVNTSLGKALEPYASQHPGRSGFHFLKTGTESLRARLTLVQGASKTLDLQYYTIHDDTSVNLLLQAMILAARRGVRVRFLIDNTSMKDVGKSLSILDAEPNISIRVFNPLATRKHSFLSRVFANSRNLGKAVRRMHNKALIVDGLMAIVGGRNLGDEYFDAHADANFKDTDLLAAGPIVAEVSASFERYWNGKDSYPITKLREHPADSRAAEKLKSDLAAHWEKQLQSADSKEIPEADLADQLKTGEMKLIWAEAELAADDPGKINDDPEKAVSEPFEKLQALLEAAKREFVMASPYFVPGSEGITWLTALVGRGLKVRLLTNSLASTDVVAVHTGYRKYRGEIIQSGIELYEMKPRGGKRPRQRVTGTTTPAHARLHAKIYVIDRRTLVIGSFNFDHRSISLNTEHAMVIHSEEIAEQVLSMFDEATAPQASYHVTADSSRKNHLVWTTQKKGKTSNYQQEPDCSLWRRLQMHLMRLLPLERQL